MSDALIGYTGFVGGTLRRARAFDGLFNSQNIEEIAGREFETVVCAGAPAEKWKANQDPELDRTVLTRLRTALGQVRAARVILISTVDVYSSPSLADENSLIDSAANHAYGRHRRELEEFVQDNFQSCIVRLPGLFGNGLKKNVIYDLLNNNQAENINPASVFQFYDMTRLSTDLSFVTAQGLTLVNLVPEPTSIDQIARVAFDRELPFLDKPAARYDVRTVYAREFGGAAGYIESAAKVLQRIRAYVQSERKSAV